MPNYKLLSVGKDAKTIKGEKIGVLTGILYLAPSTEIPGYNQCPNASPGCKAACLYTAGMGKFPQVKKARIKKTKLFYEDRIQFFKLLRKDIETLEREATRRNMTPAIRLNGTSDLLWENVGPGIFAQFPSMTFYDYTKSPIRMRKFLRGELPKNYFLTFSRSETNHRTAMKILREGGNVAMVFRLYGRDLPATYRGFRVIDGDQNDVRFQDKTGIIVALVAKGEAKKDQTGFVIG